MSLSLRKELDSGAAVLRAGLNFGRAVSMMGTDIEGLPRGRDLNLGRASLYVLLLPVSHLILAYNVMIARLLIWSIHEDLI